VLVGLIGLGGLGCSNPTTTAFVLEVNGDLGTNELSKIWVRLGSPEMEGRLRLECDGRLPFSVEVRAPARTDQPLTRVSIEAFQQSNVLLKTVAEASFKKDATLLLDTHLNRACIPAACDNITQTCGANGTCVPVRRQALPAFKSSKFGKTNYCKEVEEDKPTPPDSDAGDGGDGGNEGGPDGPLPKPQCEGDTVALECPNAGLSVCVGGTCSAPPELKPFAPSLLQGVTLRPVMQEVLVGLSNDDYAARRDKLNAAGWRNFAIGVSRIPPTLNASFSSIFVFDTLKLEHSAWRNMSVGTYDPRALEYSKDYRFHDLVAHLTTSASLRYHAIWVQEATKQVLTHGFRDLPLPELVKNINAQKAFELYPLRIHGYTGATSTLFSAVYTEHPSNKDFRVVLNKDASEYATEANVNTADGYKVTDFSAYPDGGSIRYTAIFTKMPGYRSWSNASLSLEDFHLKHAALVSQDYTLNDVEYYSAALDKEEGRVAAAWLRRDDEDLESSVGLEALPAAAQTPLAELRSQLQSFQGHAGFVVEDLKNGNYLTFHGHDMFYAAGLLDILVAHKVLQAVDVGTLQLHQPLLLENADILTTQDAVNAIGSYRVLDLLKHMLNGRSLNARERLLRHITPEVVSSTLFGRPNVGALKDTCATDKWRLSLGSACPAGSEWLKPPCCVNNIDCKVLENWLRDGHKGAPDSQSSLCFSVIESSEKEAAHIENEYAQLHASYVNSLTPIEYARILRFVMSAELSTHSRALLLALMDRGKDEAALAPNKPFYARMSTLRASDRRVENLAGLGYDVDASFNTANAQFTFSVFTENLPSDSEADREAARALIANVLPRAQAVLLAARR
jgi:hypothetical protein